jgi:hypothetical protein
LHTAIWPIAFPWQPVLLEQQEAAVLQTHDTGHGLHSILRAKASSMPFIVQNNINTESVIQEKGNMMTAVLQMRWRKQGKAKQTHFASSFT